MTRLQGRAGTLLPDLHGAPTQALTSTSLSCFSIIYFHFSKSAVLNGDGLPEGDISQCMETFYYYDWGEGSLAIGIS